MATAAVIPVAGRAGVVEQHIRGGGRVAELAVSVGTPAAQRAVREEGAGVRAASGDGHGGGDPGDGRRSRVEGGWRVGNGVAGPVAELAVVVLAPAPHGAVPEQRAGVEGAGGDSDGGGDPGDWHRSCGDPFDGGRITELSGIVSSPALQRAVR